METNSGIESKARQLLEGRIASVTSLAGSLEQLSEVRTKIAEAERAAATAWSTAMDAGWTESELRHLGFTHPGGKRTGRSTSTARRRQQSAAPTATNIEADA